MLGDPTRFVTVARREEKMRSTRCCICLLIACLPGLSDRVSQAAQELITTERLSGEGVWVDPRFDRLPPRVARVRATVWFEHQLLGDGQSYQRRARQEFSTARRTLLRERVVKTLKHTADDTWEHAQSAVDDLVTDGVIRSVERHWIVNGFSCVVDRAEVGRLGELPGVRKVFCAVGGGNAGGRPLPPAPALEQLESAMFDPDQHQHPWYVRYLQADRVWRELGVTGAGTLNVIHDFNFVFSDSVRAAVYRNPGEVPDNGKDDDGNGLIDDVHGFGFDRNTNRLTRVRVPAGGFQPQAMHGHMCAAIISGRGIGKRGYEFGIAPRSEWAGVIAGNRLERAVEWAIEQGADTYSMSFSIPGLGDYRSHWRKVMEHGSWCGVCFVSGAGNFATTARVPVQMRTPEDIPEAVFAAAGVQRNFSRTPFSSKGPVLWQTEHYKDGEVQKPEVCAFNAGLPVLLLNGQVRPAGLNGNSFAGPMFCGAIALMLSADPDLLPWDLKDIITETATDVAAVGVDDATGHGLINCYRAVREVLRRKAVREGRDAAQWTGREENDEIDIAAIRERLSDARLVVMQVQPGSQAAKNGLKRGDVILRYDGKPIRSQTDLRQAKRITASKEKVELVYDRNGEENTVTVGPGPLGFVPQVQFADPTFR